MLGRDQGIGKADLGPYGALLDTKQSEEVQDLTGHMAMEREEGFHT